VIDKRNIANMKTQFIFSIHSETCIKEIFEREKSEAKGEEGKEVVRKSTTTTRQRKRLMFH
jgi:hypothetical protein